MPPSVVRPSVNSRSYSICSVRHSDMKLFVSFAVALLSHLLFGWIWGVLGGVLVGWLSPKGGWWKGVLVVACAWAALIGYNFVVAAGPVAEMHRVMADIIGDLPAGAFPLMSVGAGGMIGLAGGLVGSAARHLARTGNQNEQVTT